MSQNVTWGYEYRYRREIIIGI